MCRCTPEMRTPFCGKPGCEMPAQPKDADAELRRHVEGESGADIVERVAAAFGAELAKIMKPSAPPKREKSCYIGAPAVFALIQCCQQLNDAFGGFGCYQVGSSLHRQDWRDVDVRFILKDEEFDKLFPDAGQHWEHDPRWLLMTISIAGWLSKQTGLPIDFQFQPQTHANKHHGGNRNALGLRIKKEWLHDQEA